MQKQSVLIDKNTVISLRNENEKLAEINNELREKNAFLEHELANLKRMIFGQKRERFIPVDDGQLSFGFEGPREPEEVVEEKTITYTLKKKGQAVRLVLPAHLPRQREIIEPEDKQEDARKIGESVTEILEYQPGKLYVQQYIRPKYVQEGKVITGNLPTLPIPQGNAGPKLLAYLLISKFVDHLPFYRQVQMFKREGVKIAESTISGWFRASCNLLDPLYEVLRRKVRGSCYINVDEIPIPVQSSDKKGATHTGYHWVYLSPENGLVCFDYRKGRGNDGPKVFLDGFEGALQTDGYAGYEQFEAKPAIVLLACMAHARRYFDKAKDNDPERAQYVLKKIQELYKIEREAKDAEMKYQQRFELRQQKALPILDELENWLKANITEVLPKSAIGIAVAYTLRLWPRLKRYTENGMWEIDNNMVENSIRPVALGRKNYLFAGSHNAAQHAAMMYSFLGTCKKNDIEPFEWLSSTLSKIPDCKLSELENLLPIKNNIPLFKAYNK